MCIISPFTEVQSCQGWLWSTWCIYGIVAHNSLLAFSRYQMASTEQILLPGAVKAPILTTEASRTWGSLPSLRQHSLAFERAAVPGFQFLLRDEPCRSLDPAEGRTIPPVFCASGSNGYSKWASKGCRLSHAIHLMQSVPLQLLPIFPPQPFLKVIDGYHLAQGVSSYSGKVLLLLTCTSHPLHFLLLPLLHFCLSPVCLCPAWTVVVPDV